MIFFSKESKSEKKLFPFLDGESKGQLASVSVFVYKESKSKKRRKGGEGELS